MKKKIHPLVKSAVKLIITAAILYFVFTKINLKDVLAVFRVSSWLLFIPGLLFFLISKWLSADRLLLFIQAIYPSFSKGMNYQLYLLGMFYNLFLPGGIGGDGYKVYFLHKQFDVETKRAFWSVMIDRLSGMASLVVLAAFTSSAIVFSFPGKHWILLIIPAGYFLYSFAMKRWFIYFDEIKHKTFLISMLVQLAQLVQVLFIIWSFGIDEQLPEYLLVFLVSSVVAVLPFTIGGVGARELTFLYGARWLGLDQEAAVAISLSFYVMTALTSAAGLYFHLIPGTLKVTK